MMITFVRLRLLIADCEMGNLHLTAPPENNPPENNPRLPPPENLHSSREPT